MRKVVLSILAFVGMTSALLAYNVTFKVDMTNVSNFTVANVNGNFNGWCGGCNPMTDDNNDGIWELTIDLPVGVYEYKFTADGWNQQENLTPGTACTVTNFGFTNRTLTVSGSDIVQPVVCWGSCTTCTSVYPVTFKVDMSTVTSTFTTPTVNGLFNGWSGNANPLTDVNNDGVWETTIFLNPGTYEYKFAADNWGIQETLIPGSTCTVTNSGFTNRTVTVGSAAVVLDPVCWGACVACSQVLPSYNVTFQVDMNQQTGFTTPELNGTFNNWCGNCAQMSDSNNDGIYTVTVQLQAGTYEYKFSHDNWGGSEQLTAGSSCTVTNDGFTNRSLTVTGNTTLGAVCYGSCSACTAPTYNVTFRVDMSQQPGIVPELNGTFNNWCGACAPMTDANSDGVYEITVPLQAGAYEYKYAYGDWTGSEIIAPGSSCASSGQYINRTLVVGNAATVLPIVCYGSCTSCSVQTYNVTFQVDMSQQTGFTTPEVNGTFNSWCGNCSAMTDANNDGIWQVTIPLTAGSYEYKFSADNWGSSESLTAGTPCTVTNGGFTNRAITVSANTTVPVVCWGSCNNCQAPTYNVTFQVDMTQQTGFTTPTVNGSFNGWSGTANPLTDANNDGIWEVTLPLQAGNYEYKFAADNWGIQENLVAGTTCTVTNYGFTNRSLEVSNANVVMPVVCWNSCSACSPPTYDVTFRVDMTQQSGFTTPEVNGSFNNWCGSCNPMTDVNNDGIWEVTLPIPAGSYEYKFTADTWGSQENLASGSSCTVSNYGFTNRALTVGNTSQTLPVVCWGACTACTQLYNVTFQVDMSQQTGFTTPEVNGAFNGWCGSCNPMTDANNDGVWEVTLALPAGTYEYKYSADAWGTQETLTPGSSCTVSNYGFTNRTLTVGNAAQTLPVVCWGSCSICSAPSYNITFRVDMNQTTGFTTPEVNGTFNGWCGNCSAMSDANNDGVWEIVIPLQSGTYEYKFTADSWGLQESLTAGSACTVTNYGFTNRSLVVNGASQTLDLVCWNSCAACCQNLSYYADNDGDGVGAGSVQILCAVPTSGYSLTAGDCNDNNANIKPSATEVCGNTVDENCDGVLGVCGDEYAAATTFLNIGQFGTGVQASTSVNLIIANNSAQSAIAGNDMWYNFIASGNAIRISLKGSTTVSDDNALALYNYSANPTGALVPIVTENDVTPTSLGASLDGGNEILYYGNLVVGSTYSICVTNVNSTPGIASLTISYLNGSYADVATYTGNTNSYTNVCQNFKAKFRSNAIGYNVKRWSSSSMTGSPTWSYAIPSGTICQLGRIVPSNMTGSVQPVYVTVDASYNLPDAFGNMNTITAYGTLMSNFTLQSEASLSVRTLDQCTAGFKSITSSVATNRSVCGVSTYGWEFTQAYPIVGLPITLNGGLGASRILPLSNVQGMANGQRYNVRIRANHVDGVSASAYSESSSCVKTIGASGMVMENEGLSQSDVIFNSGKLSVYPNPTAGDQLNVAVDGMEGNLKIEIMDAAGRLIQSEQWMVTGAMNQRVQFNSALPVGMYQLRSTMGNESQTIKFIVAR